MQIECNQPNINSLLPEEDLLKCFSYFNLTDMPSIEKVCILWKCIAFDECLWKSIAFQRKIYLNDGEDSVRAKVIQSITPYCRAARMIFKIQLKNIPLNLAPVHECMHIEAHLRSLDLLNLAPVKDINRNPRYFFKPMLDAIEDTVNQHLFSFLERTLKAFNFTALDEKSIIEIKQNPLLFYTRTLEQIVTSFKKYLEEGPNLDLPPPPQQCKTKTSIWQFIFKCQLHIDNSLPQLSPDDMQIAFREMVRQTDQLYAASFSNNNYMLDILKPWMAIHYRIPLTQVLLNLGIPMDDDVFKALIPFISHPTLAKYAVTYVENLPLDFIASLCHSYAYQKTSYPDYMQTLVKNMDEFQFQALFELLGKETRQYGTTESMRKSARESLLAIRSSKFCHMSQTDFIHLIEK